MERVLDWRPRWDPRSDAFRLGVAGAAMCSTLASHQQSMRTKSVWLDQGREGACTGFGCEHALAMTPRPKYTSNSLAQQVYIRARTLDEWPGEDYEGSSVNGAMKAEREMGRVRGWLWAKTMQEVRHGLSYHGAGVMGSWWKSDMWNTDINGFIHATGDDVGGHAYAIGGFQPWKGTRRYRIDNSWGPDWGVQGSAWITEEDLAQLLSRGGEMAFPQKVRD